MSETNVTLPIFLPAFKIIPTYETNIGGIWFNPEKHPCCAAGILYSEKQADVVSMQGDGFQFPASEHLISPPLQNNESIIAPSVSFQFSASGNKVVNAGRFSEEETPAQFVCANIATFDEILNEKTVETSQLETNTKIKCQYKLMCTEEEKLTALSRLQVIKQTMQQRSRDVITPEEAGQRLQKHLNSRFDGHAEALKQYMKLKNLTCSQPPSNFTFAFSRCVDRLGKIDSVQRHAMQENSVCTSACAERCATAFIQASAPLAVNWTVQSGLTLTGENTANQVLNHFKQNNMFCVQKIMEEITGESTSTELSRYQADSSIGVVQENNKLFCNCNGEHAGECQQYNNMFKCQVACNQLMRAQKARPISLFSAACAADDCEGGACSAVNVMLYLKLNSEETIKHDILQACQCIDMFTGNPDQTTSYETHKRAFEIMALNVKKHLQQDNINVGVASLLASAPSMNQNNQQVLNDKPINVESFKTFWSEGMKTNLGGHATGLVHKLKKQVEVKTGSVKHVVNTSGSTQDFLKDSYIAEGTAPSKQIDIKTSQRQTTVSFGTDELFRTCNAQTQNAIDLLRKKYDKQPTPLIEALNVSELLTTTLNFANLSENPHVAPTNFFALGDANAKFYNTLLLSGNVVYYSADFENHVLAEGVDLTGRLPNSEVISIETSVGAEERRLCCLFDMTFHNHLLKPAQVFELRKQAGMVPSALPALVRTDYNECAFKVGGSLTAKIAQTLPRRNAQLTSGVDPLQLQINLRFPEFTQVRNLQERNALTMARKLEIRKLLDKDIQFQQGAYNNLMEVFIPV